MPGPFDLGGIVPPPPPVFSSPLSPAPMGGPMPMGGGMPMGGMMPMGEGSPDISSLLQMLQGSGQDQSQSPFLSGIFGGQPGQSISGGGGPAGPGMAQSALGGAASGAALGTAIMPGWGTAIGAVAGAALGSSK